MNWYTLASRQMSQGHQNPIANGFDDQTITGVTASQEIVIRNIRASEREGLGTRLAYKQNCRRCFFRCRRRWDSGKQVASLEVSRLAPCMASSVYITMAKLLVYKANKFRGGAGISKVVGPLQIKDHLYMCSGGGGGGYA